MELWEFACGDDELLDEDDPKASDFPRSRSPSTTGSPPALSGIADPQLPMTIRTSSPIFENFPPIQGTKSYHTPSAAGIRPVLPGSSSSTLPEEALPETPVMQGAHQPLTLSHAGARDQDLIDGGAILPRRHTGGSKGGSGCVHPPRRHSGGSSSGSSGSGSGGSLPCVSGLFSREERPTAEEEAWEAREALPTRSYRGGEGHKPEDQRAQAAAAVAPTMPSFPRSQAVAVRTALGPSEEHAPAGPYDARQALLGPSEEHAPAGPYEAQQALLVLAEERAPAGPCKEWQALWGSAEGRAPAGPVAQEAPLGEVQDAGARGRAQAHTRDAEAGGRAGERAGVQQAARGQAGSMGHDLHTPGGQAARAGGQDSLHTPGRQLFPTSLSALSAATTTAVTPPGVPTPIFMAATEGGEPDMWPLASSFPSPMAQAGPAAASPCRPQAQQEALNCSLLPCVQQQDALDYSSAASRLAARPPPPPQWTTSAPGRGPGCIEQGGIQTSRQREQQPGRVGKAQASRRLQFNEGEEEEERQGEERKEGESQGQDMLALPVGAARVGSALDEGGVLAPSCPPLPLIPPHTLGMAPAPSYHTTAAAATARRVRMVMAERAAAAAAQLPTIPSLPAAAPTEAAAKTVTAAAEPPAASPPLTVPASVMTVACCAPELPATSPPSATSGPVADPTVAAPSAASSCWLPRDDDHDGRMRRPSVALSIESPPNPHRREGGGLSPLPAAQRDEAPQAAERAPGAAAAGSEGRRPDQSQGAQVVAAGSEGRRPDQNQGARVAAASSVVAHDRQPSGNPYPRPQQQQQLQQPQAVQAQPRAVHVQHQAVHRTPQHLQVWGSPAGVEAPTETLSSGCAPPHQQPPRSPAGASGALSGGIPPPRQQPPCSPGVEAAGALLAGAQQQQQHLLGMVDRVVGMWRGRSLAAEEALRELRMQVGVNTSVGTAGRTNGWSCAFSSPPVEISSGAPSSAVSKGLQCIASLL